MYDLLYCLTVEHNPTMVLLALSVCVLGALAMMRLTYKARATSGPGKAMWVAAAATAGAVSIWSTHFIAMLGYAPYPDMGFDAVLTALSLGVVVVYMAAGIGLAAQRSEIAILAGGFLAGSGVAAMHYLGMYALEIPARLTFSATGVALSVLAGSAFYALAMRIDIRSLGRFGATPGALLIVLGTLVIHFFGMTSLTATPDPTMGISPNAVERGTLAVIIAITSAFVLIVCLVCVGFDDRMRANRVAERARLKALADAAVEGLVICESGRIVDVNASFARLIGSPINALAGQDFAALVAPQHRLALAAAGEDAHIEIELVAAGEDPIPVEIVARDIAVQGMVRRILAVRDLRERRQAEHRIRHMAYHDALTGLPNRVRFAEVLSEHVTAKRPLAVFCIDLDRFKEVNDLFGHTTGDAFLCRLADVMQARIGPDDMIARIGGDEFMILQVSNHLPENAELLAEALIEAVCVDIEINSVSIRGGCSIGIALFPQDGKTPEQLQTHADAALYRAKEAGRGNHRFFEPEMDHRLRERRAMQNEMRQGLRNGEFLVHYQPQFETASTALSGFEALLRWTSPTRGAVPPSVFIPLAEETGFIVDLGEFVLREACREAAGWGNPLTIGVNLSPVQFQFPDLDRAIARILAETGLDPRRLELEITEGVLMRDLPRALETLKRIKAMGIAIAMDDFGTGYSSLSYLQAFPFDRIKIDGSFIRDLDSNPQSEAIIRAVVSLGRGLGLPILAEGVETERQHAFLTELDCQSVQGYLLGRPQPINMFEPLLARFAERDVLARA